MTGKTTDRIAAELTPDALAPIVRQLLGSAAPEEVEKTVWNAFLTQAGTVSPGREDDVAEKATTRLLVHQLYGLFKFFTQDERGRAKWQRLRALVPELDRDRAVLNLWKILEARHRDGVEALGTSLSYHRTWLFDWYLGRYDVRHARRALGGGRWHGNLHLLLLVLVGALFLGRRFPAALDVPDWTSAAWFAALAVTAIYLLVVALAAFSFLRGTTSLLEAGILALQSLVPRLAAAGIVGLVILGSSAELLGLVAFGISWPWLCLPLAGGYLYLLLEMARRIHPLPPLRRLSLHGFDIWATALAHAMALTLVTERGLGKILGSTAQRPLGWQAAVNVAVFVFIIGLVVNLVWAENPVTEPL